MCTYLAGTSTCLQVFALLGEGEIAIGASNSKSTESIPLRPTQLIANCHYTKWLKDIIYTIALKKIDPTIFIC